MIELKLLSNKEKKQIKKLYKAAFPKEERKPWNMIKSMCNAGKGEMLIICDDEKTVGLSFTLTDGETVLLDYLAIEAESRSKGYGAKALTLLSKRYHEKTIVIEIEKPDENADNNADRLRRREFYLRNGVIDSGTEIYLFGVKMQLLYLGDKPITYERYYEMLRTAFGDKKQKILEKYVKKI